MHQLRQCQWYWGAISAKVAERLLRTRPAGTFLVRDSHSENSIFSISYSTENGVYHSRVSRFNGRFCLGGPNALIRSDSLIDFVEQTVRSSNEENRLSILMHPSSAEPWKTIYALSSGALPSAIAIVRISGDQSCKALELLTRRRNFESRKMVFTKIFNEQGEILDHGMAVFLKGPSTSTGEDTAELYLHGSRAVVNAVCATLSKFPDVVSAKAGEFTKRAFFNGKLDLAQVEALSDLINAETEAQRKLALRQNDAGRYLKPIREELVRIIAELEASIDFADDVEDNMDRVLSKVDALASKLRRIRRGAERGSLIRNGVHVALLGPTNVGKSSLINRLAEKDIAIVSSISGTTRDSVETRIQLNSIPLIVTDTAGIRTTDDPLEVEGIRRSLRRAEEADILVLVLDADNVGSLQSHVDDLLNGLPVGMKADVVVCVNKADLVTFRPKLHARHSSSGEELEVVWTSCVQDNGLDHLTELISKRLETLSDDEGTDVALSRTRHVELLEEALTELESVREAAFETEDAALAAQHLRNCAEAVGEIAGTIVNEHILDNIFSQFCIGK
ncbi:tRNA modification GTPase TrmE family protein [Aphelenchoides avenae]|nr:tRNA modification GTPase TrmE family protein [Aphelenchus avenae]